MKDPNKVKSHCKSIKQLRVHIFLAELDEDFDSIRREILLKDPMPNLNERYWLIRREAGRSATLKSDFGTSESSAMVARNRYN